MDNLENSEPKPERQPVPPTGIPHGTFDGSGAGDHDQPFRFGSRPRALAPYPFSERQYARLLIMRSRVSDPIASTERWLETDANDENSDNDV